MYRYWSPVVHLGDVGLLERVLDRQLVELEILVELLFDLPGRGLILGLEVHPDDSFGVPDRLGDPGRGPVEVQVARAIAIDDADGGPPRRRGLRGRRGIGRG